jgi:hypothetical protein
MSPSSPPETTLQLLQHSTRRDTQVDIYKCLRPPAILCFELIRLILSQMAVLLISDFNTGGHIKICNIYIRPPHSRLAYSLENL